MAARSDPRFTRLLTVAIVLSIAACTPAARSSEAPATPGATDVPSSAPPSPTAGPAFPVTVTDDEGTEVVIPAEPMRIVSLTPATTETLFALDVGDRVVAKVEDVANFPPAAAAVPVVATFAGVDVEQIVALEADLVVSGGAGLSQGPAVEQLRRAGIPVVVSYPTTIDAGLASIALLGAAVGRAEAGAMLAETLRNRLDDLAVIASTATSRPRAFYEIDVTGGIFTPPADSIYGEMLRLAGSDPISGDINYSISLEDLVAADPEVILLGDGAYGQTPETVAARAGWGGMTAVREGRIVAVDDIVITRPGPRLVEGLYALVLAIHPELEGQLPVPGATPIPATGFAALAEAA